mmetsp:Transcript_16522/g.32807  ORF Transcript_16522/g.32807 Transcript_16522/m.32807 type:complete len:642 (+) Transcript_16522:146-2071(+)
MRLLGCLLVWWQCIVALSTRRFAAAFVVPTYDSLLRCPGDHHCLLRSHISASTLSETKKLHSISSSDFAGEESAFVRASEIASVVLGQVMSPLIGSLLTNGLPTNWEAFWGSCSTLGGTTNGDQLAQALEQLGPTYVKFGQALGSRPDIIPDSLATAFCKLHDDMEPFDTSTAKEIISLELFQNGKADPNAVKELVESLAKVKKPIAAASVGQVYKANLPGFGDVAIKVQRPGIRALVERDASLLRTVATWAESLPALPNQRKRGQGRLIATELVAAVDEFMSRLFEELDYKNEAKNAAIFAKLYSSRDSADPDVQVIVPEFLPNFCTENVVVMQWLEGTKLTNFDVGSVEENLAVVKKATQCTLKQLLVDGVLHADPHSGNLLKIKAEGGRRSDVGYDLGYLDFGIISTVPSQVRDALVCATALLVFEQDVDAVAGLFGELQLLPAHVLNDPEERAALNAAMETTMSECLRYVEAPGSETQIPVLLFDKLLDALARLVPRFSFKLPPYFINNARAMSTLEGVARTLDPSFNVFEVMYPFALNLLLQNPSGSPVVDATLQRLIRSPESDRIDPTRIRKLLRDSSLMSGYRKRKVVWDIAKTRKGRRLGANILMEDLNHRVLDSRLGIAIRRIRKNRKSAQT